MKPTVQELTAAERQWLAAQMQRATTFVSVHSTVVADRLTLEDLDRAFAAWLAEDEPDTDKVNETIDAVGVAFGSFLVRDAGFSWVIATDEYGSDLAVLALPGTADILVYPANFVAKRWERRETSFMQSAFQDMAKRRKELAGVGGVAEPAAAADALAGAAEPQAVRRRAVKSRAGPQIASSWLRTNHPAEFPSVPRTNARPRREAPPNRLRAKAPRRIVSVRQLAATR